MQTLVISGSVDVSTPAADATRELMPRLPHGRQVVLEELGHTEDFWSYQPAASSRLINTFYESGKVDDSLYTRNSIDSARTPPTPRWPSASWASWSASSCWRSSRCAALGVPARARPRGMVPRDVDRHGDRAGGSTRQ
ncbi:MAG: hypothetical protein ACRDLS_17820 [Solirubrobacteraceae bacterium]